ncbi:MAG: ATP-binding protein [Roseburia sp.]|nr:ATP-binding protein [Roseburia sp.]
MALKQSQYESIIRTYEQTRERNRHLTKQRREQVYADIPQMSALDDEIHSLALERTRRLLETDAPSSEGLREDFARIVRRRKALLQQAGLPEDYLEPVYTCSLCRDTGYCVNENGYKEKCQCFRSQELTILYEQSNIQDIISRENFSTLSYEYCEGEDLERLKRAVKKCLSFIKDFETDYQNLLFYGTVGTGKSFLSGCVARELLERGYSVIYFSATGLFELLARYSFDRNAKETLYNFYKDLYNYDCVIIDDLGTEVTNSFVTSQLFSFLNERHMGRKATIISTNLNLEELRDRYSDRIFSRITSNYTICKLTGPDVRMSRSGLHHVKP